MITITELASTKVKSLLDKRGGGLGIKIGVRTTGCSGLAYVLEYVDSELSDTEYYHYENHQVSIWVDKKSHIYVDGMTVDWKRQGLNEGFDFINDNVKNVCGCGESFTV